MARVIIITFLFPVNLMANVIDLGTLEVEGEVRQPKVQFYNSSRVADSHIKNVAEKELLNIEKEVLLNLSKLAGEKNVTK